MVLCRCHFISINTDLVKTRCWLIHPMVVYGPAKETSEASYSWPFALYYWPDVRHVDSPHKGPVTRTGPPWNVTSMWFMHPCDCLAHCRALLYVAQVCMYTNDGDNEASFGLPAVRALVNYHKWAMRKFHSHIKSQGVWSIPETDSMS